MNLITDGLSALNNVSKKYKLGEPTFVTTSGIIVPNDGIVIIVISPSNTWGACAIDGVTAMQFYGHTDMYIANTTPVKAGQIAKASYVNAQLVSVKYYPYVLK